MSGKRGRENGHPLQRITPAQLAHRVAPIANVGESLRRQTCMNGLGQTRDKV
jgi:hypothetical protein